MFHTCTVFCHFPSICLLLWCLFPRRKWLAGKLNAFGLLLERSQLLQVSKLARAWCFLENQGRGAVSDFILFCCCNGNMQVVAACNTKRIQRAPNISRCCLQFGTGHSNQHKWRIVWWDSPSRISIEHSGISSPSLMWSPHHQFPQAFTAEPCHACNPQIPSHPKPAQICPVSANCTSCSLQWSLSPFLSLETEGTRKSQISRAEGSLKKDAVSREEYGYKQYSSNTVLSVCSRPVWTRNNNPSFVPATLYCLLQWAILIYADVKEREEKEMCQGCSAL